MVWFKLLGIKATVWPLVARYQTLFWNPESTWRERMRSALRDAHFIFEPLWPEDGFQSAITLFLGRCCAIHVITSNTIGSPSVSPRLKRRPNSPIDLRRHCGLLTCTGRHCRGLCRRFCVAINRRKINNVSSICDYQ